MRQRLSQRPVAVWLCLVLIVLMAGPAGAASQTEGTTDPVIPPAEDYKNAQVVTIAMGASNHEQGIRLLSLFADGAHEPVNLGGSEGRRTMAPAGGGERFFYFDVHDTYLYNGTNSVQLTVTYLDLGLGSIVLDYDAVSPTRPQLGTPKRVQLATRGNTEAWKTVRVRIDDARLAGGLGGADFRIGSSTDLILRAVGVWKLNTNPPQIIKVLIDGNEVRFTDAYPFITQSRVLVPLRAIFEALGANVQWFQETRTIVATRGDTTIRMSIGNPVVQKNLETFQVDVPAQLVGGRTYVPLRFVSESFGLRVTWDGENQQVIMQTGVVPAVTPPPGEGTGAPEPPPPGAADPCDPSLPWWLRGADCPPPANP